MAASFIFNTKSGIEVLGVKNGSGKSGFDQAFVWL